MDNEILFAQSHRASANLTPCHDLERLPAGTANTRPAFKICTVTVAVFERTEAARVVMIRNEIGSWFILSKKYFAHNFNALLLLGRLRAALRFRAERHYEHSSTKWKDGDCRLPAV